MRHKEIYSNSVNLCAKLCALCGKKGMEALKQRGIKVMSHKEIYSNSVNLCAKLCALCGKKGSEA